MAMALLCVNIVGVKETGLVDAWSGFEVYDYRAWGWPFVYFGRREDGGSPSDFSLYLMVVNSVVSP